MNEFEALARTSQLINADFFFGEADETAIVRELRSSRVRIVCDEANAASAAGQTAVVVLTQLVTMLGFDVALDVPDSRLLAPQPPLRGHRLRSALADYVVDLIPGQRVTASDEAEDVTFVIGSTHADRRDWVRLSADAWHCRVDHSSVSAATFEGNWPIGALGAAAAAAPEALRSVLPRIERSLGVPLARETHRLEFSPIGLDLSLPGLAEGPLDVGRVDFVSGGAITTAALAVLARLPEFAGVFRVIEDDTLWLSNLNRYVLARRSAVGDLKADVLASFADRATHITACPRRFEEEHRGEIGDLAPRVMIGVDDIPSRWAVQREWPPWLCVGATSHLEVRLSAHRRPGPCAGCAHPEDEVLDGEIPTISFVSFWAGLLQARELLADAVGRSPSAPIYWCSPFNLAGKYGLTPWGLAPRAKCPVGCPASLERRRESV
jgi:hypothetical protein